MSSHSVIVDLEATCCDQNTVPRDEMEIIEIGAVRINHESGEIESEFASFVRPARHPTLTNFCKELTTIAQEDVDDAEPYPDVLAKFAEWLQLRAAVGLLLLG